MYCFRSRGVICNEKNFTEKLKFLLNVFECDRKPILKFTGSNTLAICKFNFIFIGYILMIISKGFAYVTLKHLVKKLIKFFLSITICLFIALSNCIHDAGNLIAVIRHGRRYSLHVIWNIIQGICWIKLIHQVAKSQSYDTYEFWSQTVDYSFKK